MLQVTANGTKEFSKTFQVDNNFIVFLRKNIDESVEQWRTIYNLRKEHNEAGLTEIKRTVSQLYVLRSLGIEEIEELIKLVLNEKIDASKNKIEVLEDNELKNFLKAVIESYLIEDKENVFNNFSKVFFHDITVI